jgi:hypothetical protein
MTVYSPSYSRKRAWFGKTYKRHDSSKKIRQETEYRNQLRQGLFRIRL